MINKAKKLQSEMIAWRRDIHMHPELGFEEKRTSALIAERMEEMGYRVKTGIGKTGVVAELGEGKPVVAIRADMDALPIQEANDVPYKSKHDGVMHACGHDAHVAMAMGTGKLLAAEEFPGTVRFLFQPSEETDDGELSGAPRMIEDGAMEGVDYVLGQHVDASIRTGEIEVATEFASAGVDTMYATIIGQGGHGSAPHEVIDPIFISGYVILALHGIVSRQLKPSDPGVISIGSIHGGVADNVIPEKVEMMGTIRYFSPEVQEKIHAEIKKALDISRSLGGDYKLKIQVGYPPMHNHPDVVALVKKVAGDLLGEDKINVPELDMGAEDFAYFLEKAPGAMYMLGCQVEGDTRRHHDPKFDIDEDCLQLGAALMTESALRLLRGSE
ncbi:MAG: amidohydrolase [Chloroflexi bacterium]|nr:MAG: amidohydrolase [Chloroflexota bacterium]